MTMGKSTDREIRARVLYRYAKTLNLTEWGLDGLAKHQSVTLYHGTTALFRKFDLNTVREDLVNNYYGGGIFLTPSKRIAEQYAQANRNMGFPPSIIEQLKRKNPRAGAFMQALYSQGVDAWDALLEDIQKQYPDEKYPISLAEQYLGVDPNTIQDVADYILGSKVKPLGGGDGNIFNMSTGLPEYVYQNLDELGLDSKTYRPKVYTVSVTVNNPLVTASKSEAMSAKHKGYDAVVFYGSDLVGGVPEVAVFNPSAVKIKHVEVV